MQKQKKKKTLILFHRLPAPVRLSKKGLIKQEIEKAIQATYYYVVSGPCR
jgi:hypothetical protein